MSGPVKLTGLLGHSRRTGPLGKKEQKGLYLTREDLRPRQPTTSLIHLENSLLTPRPFQAIIPRRMRGISRCLLQHFSLKRAMFAIFFPVIGEKEGVLGAKRIFPFALDCVCEGKACGSGPKSSGLGSIRIPPAQEPALAGRVACGIPQPTARNSSRSGSTPGRGAYVSTLHAHER